ncbi:hypothetical protein SDC9_109292 [bioreactor metagenome]|uniref:Uncharacterized protein n=1 Tax=bioreactor metagenome TaxID=1076179 RepID=A0A645BCQ3_9ZZZZ
MGGQLRFVLQRDQRNILRHLDAALPQRLKASERLNRLLRDHGIVNVAPGAHAQKILVGVIEGIGRIEFEFAGKLQLMFGERRPETGADRVVFVGFVVIKEDFAPPGFVQTADGFVDRRRPGDHQPVEFLDFVPGETVDFIVGIDIHHPAVTMVQEIEDAVIPQAPHDHCGIFRQPLHVGPVDFVAASGQRYVMGDQPDVEFPRLAQRSGEQQCGVARNRFRRLGEAVDDPGTAGGGIGALAVDADDFIAQD